MKKLLVLTALIALSTTTVFAANSTLNNLKNGVKQDVKAAKSAVKQDVKTTKNAVKTDINNAKADAKAKAAANKNAQATAAAEKKAEKIAKIDAKIKELNAELAKVKADKTITETERTTKSALIQKQITFYNNQKAALK